MLHLPSKREQISSMQKGIKQSTAHDKNTQHTHTMNEEREEGELERVQKNSKGKKQEK